MAALHMILECPSCATRYDIPAALPPDGRKVRCAKCGHVWVALPESLLTEPPPPPPPPEPTVEEDADLVFQDFVPEPEPEAPVPEEAPPPEEVGPVMAGAPEEPSFAVEDAAMEEEPEPAPEAQAASWPMEEPEAPAWQEEEQPAIPMAEWHAAEPVVSALEERQEAPPVDASFEEEEAAGAANAPLPPMPPVTGVETPSLAEGTARPPSRFPAALAAGWGVLALLVLGLLGGAYLFRVDIVRALPGAAKLYALAGLPVNVRNLEFEDVSYAWAVDDGRLILEVRGEVVNISDEPVQVPTVTFNLRNDQDADVFQWEADIRTEPLAARERTRFVARIPTPPKAVRSLQVRFADRG